MREGKNDVAAMLSGMPEPDTRFAQKSRQTWAALIKAVCEVNPLMCPKPVLSEAEV
jgi:hypothetical protein